MLRVSHAFVDVGFLFSLFYLRFTFSQCGVWCVGGNRRGPLYVHYLFVYLVSGGRLSKDKFFFLFFLGIFVGFSGCVSFIHAATHLCAFLALSHSFFLSCHFLFFLFFTFSRLALVCSSFSHSLHTRFVRAFSGVLVCRASVLCCFSFFLVSFDLRYDFSFLWADCVGGIGRALCAFCSWSVIMFLGCESFLHSSCAPAEFWAPTDHSSMSCSSSLLF